jgi:hypothetical protein
MKSREGTEIKHPAAPNFPGAIIIKEPALNRVFKLVDLTWHIQ